MDVLAQLKTGPKEPTLEGIENKERDNEQFKKEQESATAEDTEKLKQEVRNSLYGSFQSPEEVDLNQDHETELHFSEEQEKENQEETESVEKETNSIVDEEKEVQENIDITDDKFKDSPLYPVLDGLFEQGHIDFDEYTKVKEKVQDSDKEETSNLIMSLVDDKVIDTKLKDSLKKQLTSPERVTEETFDKTEFAKHKDILGLDKGIGGLELILAENYLNIPDINGNENIEQNLANTMDVVLNKILEKNSVEFKEQNALLVGIIRNSSSLTERYSKLKELYKEDLKTDAIAGGKKYKEQASKKRESLKSEAQKLTNKIELARTQGREEELKQLEIQKKEIIDEANETDNIEVEIGEIFKGGEEDKSRESIEAGIEAA